MRINKNVQYGAQWNWLCEFFCGPTPLSNNLIENKYYYCGSHKKALRTFRVASASTDCNDPSSSACEALCCEEKQTVSSTHLTGIPGKAMSIPLTFHPRAVFGMHVPLIPAISPFRHNHLKQSEVTACNCYKRTSNMELSHQVPPSNLAYVNRTLINDDNFSLVVAEHRNKAQRRFASQANQKIVAIF